ncbi:hypothetical protein [Pseudactinotalea sp. Z1732]|uniref:hypothetical protein n=1 Tax=Micrococcales TaxID=85006 RepID=UPI003C7D8588
MNRTKDDLIASLPRSAGANGGIAMTRDREIKQRARMYQREHGGGYANARRTVTQWPAETTLKVDERPQHFLMLLYVRHAWGIAVDESVPELEPAPEPGHSQMPETASQQEWSSRWSRAWQRAWDWYRVEDRAGSPPDERTVAEIARPGQPLSPSLPPQWAHEHGRDGVDMERYSLWLSALLPDFSAAPHEHPEHISAEPVTQAAAGGLETVVVLPYAEPFARRITRRHLVVSAATRRDC